LRLADFLLSEADAIVEEWESFARTCLPAAGHMNDLELRDHARQILHAIAVDLRTTQSRDEQTAKSKGLAPVAMDASETAAQIHAVLRAKSGFDVRQLVAEYRALRASVLRLAFDAWAPAEVPMDDVLRFNEAIDEALAESVSFYSTQVERSRNLLLGMLGHDMRSPLQAMQMTASYLAALNAGEEVSDAAARLIRSGARMQWLLDGLVDFNRTQLGLGLNVDRRPGDLGEHCASKLEEVRAAYSSRVVEFAVEGDCRGMWDGERIGQLVGNLVINAVKYGAQDAPIRVAVGGGERAVTIDVVNQGVPDDPDELPTLFEPLQRGEGEDTSENASLGLGLFIAREIARAHGGSVDVRCEAGETIFSVRLLKSS
jgi:signal transduction histidine kinase